jgi:hypothetical protein
LSATITETKLKQGKESINWKTKRDEEYSEQEKICVQIYMLGKEIRVKHSPQVVTTLKVHSGKYKELYFSISYVTRRLLTVEENMK